MADTLPLWRIAPNWSNPVIERIEFSTDVLSGTLGHEQAVALRYLPRRTIEATFTPCDAERTFAALALQRAGAEQWRVPLWFDSTKLTAAATSGASTLYLNTVNREYRAGDYAYLVSRDNMFASELVEVLAVYADRITLAGSTTAAWSAGTRIHPCRPAWLDAGDLGGITSRVASFTARFEIDTDTDYSLGVETAPTYQGSPLLLQRPNWSDPVELSFEQRFEEFDPGIGGRARSSPADRAFSVTRYSLLLDGLAEVSAYRSLLYRLRGRQRPAWVPTQGRDLAVVAPAALGTSQLDIAQVGLGLLGGIAPDIADVLVGGDLPIRLSGLGVSPGAGVERLLTAVPLSRAVATGERAALLSLVRLEQDVVTITHVTDTVARSSLAWKSFAGGRSGLAAGALDIPTTAMNSTPCGVAPPAPLLPLTIVSTLPAIGAGKAISFVLSFGIMGPSGLAEFSIERTWYSDGSGIAPTGTISQTNNGVTVSIAYDYDVVDGLSIQIDSATEVSDFVNTVAPTAYKPVAGPSELWISMSSADLGLVGYLPTVASGVNVGTAFLVDTYTSSGIFSHGNYKYYLSEFY